MATKHDKPKVGEEPVRQDAPPAVMALELKPGTLSPENQAYFEKCQEKLGFVPNVLSSYAFDDAKLSAFAAFYNDLMLAPSGLSKLEREMIAVAVSSVNRCYYCLTAHGAAVRQLSGDPVLGVHEAPGDIHRRHLGEQHRLHLLDVGAEEVEALTVLIFFPLVSEAGDDLLAPFLPLAKVLPRVGQLLAPPRSALLRRLGLLGGVAGLCVGG